MLSRRITYYIKALSGSFDVSLLCLKDAEHPHIERYGKARILRVPLKHKTLQQRMEQFERAIRRQLESEEYAIVHCFDFVSGRVLAELKKQLGYQLIFEATTLSSQEWPHNPLEPALSAKSLDTITAEETYTASHANVLIVASKQQKKYFLRKGFLRTPVHVLFHPSLPRKGMSAQPTARFQFLHLGGQSQLTSLQTTFNAFKAIPPESKIQLAFGGHYSAQSKAYLTALRETLNLKETIWPTLRHETEVSVLCAQANAALLTLEDEPRNVSFGGSMPELADFFAWGLPIVASDLPCTREFLNEKDALFFAPGNSTMLAERMKTLAASPQLQTQLAFASKAKAAAFEPARFIHETLRIYHPWLDKKSAPSAQLLESWPEITPSRAKTTSCPSASSSRLEHETIIVPPASFSLPPK